jgi:hypothetical protein
MYPATSGQIMKISPLVPTTGSSLLREPWVPGRKTKTATVAFIRVVTSAGFETQSVLYIRRKVHTENVLSRGVILETRGLLHNSLLRYRLIRKIPNQLQLG